MLNNNSKGNENMNNVNFSEIKVLQATETTVNYKNKEYEILTKAIHNCDGEISLMFFVDYDFQYCYADTVCIPKFDFDDSFDFISTITQAINENIEKIVNGHIRPCEENDYDDDYDEDLKCWDIEDEYEAEADEAYLKHFQEQALKKQADETNDDDVLCEENSERGYEW